MTNKDVALKVLHREKTPRQPVALLSGGVWTFNRAGLSLKEALAGGAELSARIIAETNEEVQSDVVWVGSGFHNIGIYALGGKIKFRAKGAPDVIAPLVNDVSDFDHIDLGRLKDNEEVNILWQTTHVLDGFIGDRTLVGASQWGPFTLAGHAYGVEKLMRSIYRDQAAVHAVLEYTTELCYQYLAPFVDHGAQVISIADPTASGDLISREQFREYSLPYLTKVTERLTAKGANVVIHICGNITNRLDLIPQTGANLLSVDYKVDLATVREKIGHKMAFSGNMNPVAVMQLATPAEVERICRQNIEKVGGHSSYMLMPGCDIPPQVPLENIKAMVRTAHSVEFA